VRVVGPCTHIMLGCRTVGVLRALTPSRAGSIPAAPANKVMTHTPSINGTFPSVCVDVIHTRVAMQPYVTVLFAVEAPGREGTLASAYFPLSLTSGRLRGFLEYWRGAPFTPEALDAFDIDNCVGVGARVKVQSHRTKRGTLVINVHQIHKLPADDTPALPPDYIRYHHRQPSVA
jgi:hypothetical protein